MPELLSTFFASAPFMPHGYCYLWKPGLVWLHIISDSIIALSYYSIPLTLLVAVTFPVLRARAENVWLPVLSVVVSNDML